jgi:hypothetical protein
VSLQSRSKFCKLQDISKLVSADSIGEAVELSKNAAGSWHLNDKEVKHVISSRFKFINE